MIYRAAEDVWVPVQDNTLAFIGRWHVPGVVDRAVRFMITSGRPEFAPRIWLLVENGICKSISARCARHDASGDPRGFGRAGRLASLPQETRQNVLAELAMRGRRYQRAGCLAFQGLAGFDGPARRQERRVEPAPNAAVPVAAMIFAAIERLATAGGGEPHQRIAIALGRIGLEYASRKPRRGDRGFACAACSPCAPNGNC